jgi:hypothetical protein
LEYEADEWRDFYVNFFKKLSWDVVRTCCLVERTNVAPLKREGFLHHDATTKANILNQQFASVFTEEDMDNLPDLGISPTTEMNKITINTEGAQNLRLRGDCDVQDG